MGDDSVMVCLRIRRWNIHGLHRRCSVFESGAVQDMCGEDVSFCLDAIEAGYEIWCDPRIRVGHEKPVLFEEVE